MIDIFMEALLGALVRFGTVVTIEPGIGAVAFCGVVILTIFAAETFDPRRDVGHGGAAPVRTGGVRDAGPGRSVSWCLTTTIRCIGYEAASTVTDSCHWRRFCPIWHSDELIYLRNVSMWRRKYRCGFPSQGR